MGNYDQYFNRTTGLLPEPDAPSFPRVIELATTDPVIGGPGAVDNAQAAALVHRTTYLRQQTDSLGVSMNQTASRITALESSGSASAGRALLLTLRLSEEGADFELFGDPAYTWRDMPEGPLSVIQTVAGDASADVLGGETLKVGGAYVLYDPETRDIHETLEIADLLASPRVIASAPLSVSLTGGLLSRTNWAISEGQATARNGVLFSRPLKALRYQESGRVIIQRDGGDGTSSLSVQVRRVSEPETDWQTCPLATSTANTEGTVDLEYTVPIGGTVELQVRSAVSGDTTITIDHMVLLPPVQAGRADPVRRPVAITPSSGATGVQETPVLTTSAYHSLYGLDQAAAEFRVATDFDMANVIYNAEEGATVQHTVAAGTLATETVYFWQARHFDDEGTPSDWSKATGFTTGDVFSYVKPPVVVSPAAGAAAVSLKPTIITSDFEAVGGEDHLVSKAYEISADPAFSDLAYAVTVVSSGVNHTVYQALDKDTAYYLRVKYVGASLGSSDWSITRQFRTLNQAAAPSITSPANGASNVSLTPTITTSTFAIAGGGEAHVASRYQVARDSAFTDIVLDSGETSALTSYTVSSGASLPALTTLYVRACHEGGTTGWSPWSATVQIQTTEPSGEAVYTSPGTYNWTCPPDVTSVSVVAVGGGGAGDPEGGGGGGGGGLRWANAVPVTPGQVYTVTVGKGGEGGGVGNGSASSFSTVLTAYGGFDAGGPGGGGGGGVGGNGGSTGGSGGAGSNGRPGGGGGAAGYLGNGGKGGDGGQPGSNAAPDSGGAGGGGGGDGAQYEPHAGAGGGVGLNGCGGIGSGGGLKGGGGGGSGGTNGSGGMLHGGGWGGTCGGGGAGAQGSAWAGNGGNGGVRIAWGPNVSLPYNAA